MNQDPHLPTSDEPAQALPETSEAEQPLLAQLVENSPAEPDTAADEATGGESLEQTSLQQTPVEPTAGDDPALAARRQQLAQQLNQAHRLPPALRQELTARVAHTSFDTEGREQPSLTLSQALEVFAQAWPAGLAPHDAAPAEHPRGDRFFRGHGRSPSEREAHTIAAAQLAATGFARREA